MGVKEKKTMAMGISRYSKELSYAFGGHRCEIETLKNALYSVYLEVV